LNSGSLLLHNRVTSRPRFAAWGLFSIISSAVVRERHEEENASSRLEMTQSGVQMEAAAFEKSA
jgi:hypothetical protein